MRVVPSEALSYISKAREAAIVSLGIVLVDTLAHNSIANYANGDLEKKAINALPSAFVAPRISDDIGFPSHSLDLTLDSGSAGASIALAKNTSSTKELVGIALGAQVASSATDALVSNINLLSRAESQQQDVGASAIEAAFITKFLLDRASKTESPKAKRVWLGLCGGFAIATTLGASYIDSKNATLDFTSHSTGIGVGALASYFKNRKSADYAAAQNLILGVENSRLTRR